MSSLLRRVVNDDKKLGTRVYDLFMTWMQPLQNNFHKKILYNYRLYHGYMPKSPYDPLRSTIHIPMSYAAVETMLPRLMQGIWATDPPFRANPRQPDISSCIKAEIAENLIYEYWIRAGRFLQNQLAIKDACICGLGVEKAGWVIDQDSEGNYLKDRPETKRVSPTDVAWQDDKTCADDTPIVHWRAFRKSEIDMMADSGAPLINLDKMQDGAVDKAMKAYSVNDLYTAIGLTGPLFRQNWGWADDPEGSDPWVVLLEYWDDEYMVLVDANSKMPITKPRKNLQGMKPFFFYPSNQSGDFMIGIGTIEPIAGIQESVNTHERAYQDNAVFSTHKGGLYDKSSMLSQDDFTRAPGVWRAVDVPTGKSMKDMFVPIHDQPMHQGGREAQERMTDWYERAVGQGTLQQGASSARQETYGATVTQKQEAMVRLATNIKPWSETLAKSARYDFLLMKNLMQEYHTVGVKGRNVPVKLVEQRFFPEFTDLDGHPHVQIAPGFLTAIPDGAFEFLPTGGGALAIKELIQQGLMQIMGELTADPTFAPVEGQPPSPGFMALMKELRTREIASMEIVGKEQVLRAVNAAYDEKIQQAMAPPPMAPPPPGQEGQATQPGGQPGQGPPPVAEQGAPEQQAPPPPAAPPGMAGMVQ